MRIELNALVVAGRAKQTVVFYCKKWEFAVIGNHQLEHCLCQNSHKGCTNLIPLKTSKSPLEGRGNTNGCDASSTDEKNRLSETYDETPRCKNQEKKVCCDLPRRNGFASPVARRVIAEHYNGNGNCNGNGNGNGHKDDLPDYSI